MARDYGCVGLAVDAKPDAVEFYKQYGFVSVDVAEGQSGTDPRLLAIRSIEEALGP